VAILLFPPAGGDELGRERLARRGITSVTSRLW